MGVSPDGHWMAYASNESGPLQVYVQAVPASGGKFQISNAGGTQPRWRRDGKELFYVSADDNGYAHSTTSAALVGSGPSNYEDLKVVAW